MLDDVAVLAVQDLTGEQAPENLEHEVGVVLRLVDQNLLQREEHLFGVFVLTRLVNNLGVALEGAAVVNFDAFLRVQRFESELVRLAQLLLFLLVVEHIKKLLGGLGGRLHKLGGFFLLLHEQLALDLLLECRGGTSVLAGVPLEEEKQEVRVQVGRDVFYRVRHM